MVLQEAGKFSDIAGMFYRNGIQRTVAALADWLRVQQKRGLIDLDDIDEAAGMLLGMVASSAAARSDVRRRAAAAAFADRSASAPLCSVISAGVSGHAIVLSGSRNSDDASDDFCALIA